MVFARPNKFVRLATSLGLGALLFAGTGPHAFPPGTWLLGGRHGLAADTVRYQDFVGAAACRECHQNQYEEWAQSTHGQAGGPPEPGRVLRPFDGRPLRFADAVVRPRVRTDGAYEFLVVPDGGEQLSLEVAGVIGGGHMVGGGTQGFVAAFPDGTLRFVPFDFSRTTGTWFCNTRQGWKPISESIRIGDCRDWPPNRILGDAAQTENCQSCHGSQIELTYDPTSASYQTRVNSLAINCESCHGPGARHVDLARTVGFRESTDVAIRSLGGLSADASLRVCFQCHAVKSVLEPRYLPGESLQSHYSLLLPVLASDPYLPDGRPRIFAYQLNHLASDCYLSGSMTCVDCHDPHTTTYRDIYGRPLESRFSDGQCLDCHPSKADDVPAHTHHAIDSDGSRCVSCHMPYRQQPGLGDEIRYARSDHTIAIPRPGFDESIGVVSACAQCHAENPLRDLVEQTAAWYGAIKPHRRSVTALVRATEGALSNPADLLIPDERDPMAQVAAIGRFVNGSLGTGAPTIDPAARSALWRLAVMDDIDVRAVAIAALSVLAGDSTSRRMLDDSHDAVGDTANDLRIRWVSALVIFAGTVTERGEFSEALRVLRVGLDVVPNHAITLYEMGVLFMRLGDWANAERFLVRTLDNAGTSPLNAWMVNPNRGRILTNLGVTRDQLGQPDLAAETYRLAITTDPSQAMAHFYLATYHQGRGELEQAAGLYERAISLQPSLTDAYVLLASVQRDLGRVAEAIATLDALLELAPTNSDARRMRQELVRMRDGR